MVRYMVYFIKETEARSFSDKMASKDTQGMVVCEKLSGKLSCLSMKDGCNM